MTLLETTYRQLRCAGLVHCAEEFSRYYLGKNSNWYAYQKHTGRDYSVNAAIQCLRSIRSKQHSNELSKAQVEALQRVEQRMIAHLNMQHCIAEVC
ncbi:DUF6626 family protein [Rhodovulum sp. YNF3179]|uniref:DUF6626 family protein n=1 Tax=Rhodovulum sp. YNF3179 TaxID=3425127 RepID=UPI003D350570